MPDPEGEAEVEDVVDLSESTTTLTRRRRPSSSSTEPGSPMPGTFRSLGSGRRPSDGGSPWSRGRDSPGATGAGGGIVSCHCLCTPCQLRQATLKASTNFTHPFFSRPGTGSVVLDRTHLRHGCSGTSLHSSRA